MSAAPQHPTKVLPRWLWRALGVTIALKLLALAVLFAFSFGPHHRPAVQNPVAVTQHLLGQPTAITPTTPPKSPSITTHNTTPKP